MKRLSSRLVRGVIGAALVIVLLVAMALSTKFLTAEQVAALGPEEFDPAEVAAELYDQAPTELQYAPFADVAAGIHKDVKSAAEKHGAISTSDTSYAFPVTVEAKVSAATADSLQLEVDGVDKETTVLVPLTTAVDGAALRDAMGFEFADAPGQTEYQYVANELKKLMQQAAAESVEDPASAKGKTVQVSGVLAVRLIGSDSVPTAKPLSIQPVTIEVSK